MTQRVFLIADHGLALIYYLQSDILSILLNAGIEVVLFTDEDSIPALQRRFGQAGLIFEGMRLKECENYFQTVDPFIQRCLNMLRWVGGSKRMSVVALEGNYQLQAKSFSGKGRYALPLLRLLIWIMRRSKAVRQFIIGLQRRYTPHIYRDLFEKYQPSLVIAKTPGWRLDRYLLREAASHHVPSVATVVGWDNPSSYALSGAPVDFITCWSEIQKEELVRGSDWDPERVFIGGIPAYDGYFRRTWLTPREEYFRQHGLDPQRKLITYACSFETLHPNFPNMKVLADLVNQDRLTEPCQLLIRFHPNHFIKGSRFEEERLRTIEYVKGMAHIRTVEPVSLGGGLGHYSGEDMDEKASMMAWSDVFVTVYSTMVVETAIHDRPIVSLTIDTPGGWNRKDVYSLPLTAIGDWPTHERFRLSGAGRVAADAEQARQWIDFYLKDCQADSERRRKFIAAECTFTDGSAGRRTGEYLLSLLSRKG